MDKTGIITFHETTNFGSLLQAFALYRAIEKMGHKCELIDYKCESIIKRELPPRIRCPKSIREFAKMILFDSRNRKKFKCLDRFMRGKMSVSCPYTYSTIKDAAYAYSRYIVGSDIVWGLDITDNDMTYFLDFVNDNERKFAFSSSVGDPWTEDEKLMVQPLLSSFKSIAVREEESADWIEELIARRPKVVCDPTMLLTKDEWLKYSSKRFCGGKKYIVVYFDTKQHHCIEFAIELGRAKGMPVYYINNGMPVKGVKNQPLYKLEDFLSILANAAYVVTASYHGLLFSLYFERQVWYFNRAHKSRMSTLTRRIGIENRNGHISEPHNYSDMDYNNINLNISEFRNASLAVLRSYFDK